MADVFISYSKLDRGVAEALAHDLRSNGLDVWWDFELYAGDDFHQVIRIEIAKARAVIVVWTESSVNSPWVRGEALEASELNKLISTHVSGFDLRWLPINFRAFHSEPISQIERILAAIMQKAEVVHPDRMSDIAALHVKAMEGDAFSQITLGVMYERGLDVAKDEREAARLFNLAAEYGDDAARVRLGKLYSEGRGVARDEGRAVQLPSGCQ
jgi:TPR repeat protein